MRTWPSTPRVIAAIPSQKIRGRGMPTPAVRAEMELGSLIGSERARRLQAALGDKDIDAGIALLELQREREACQPAAHDNDVVGSGFHHVSRTVSLLPLFRLVNVAQGMHRLGGGPVRRHRVSGDAGAPFGSSQ